MDVDNVNQNEEETVVTNKWVPHNEREQQLYEYQENVKTAEQEAAIWSGFQGPTEMTKEFLNEHVNILGSPMLDDDHKNYVPDRTSGGGSGVDIFELYALPYFEGGAPNSEGKFFITTVYPYSRATTYEEVLAGAKTGQEIYEIVKQPQEYSVPLNKPVMLHNGSQNLFVDVGMDRSGIYYIVGHTLQVTAAGISFTDSNSINATVDPVYTIFAFDEERGFWYTGISTGTR